MTADFAPAQRPGAALARRCSPALTAADLSTDAFPFRDAPAGRARPASGVLLRPDHLPRRAGLRALRPGRAGARGVRRRCWPPGPRTACGRSGSRRSPRCGWRRPTATSATTSTTPTARSRPGSASRVALGQAGGFVGREARGWRARRPTPRAGGMAQRIVQVRVLDPEPLLYHAEVAAAATAWPSATSGRRRTAGPSGRPSAWPWSSGDGAPVHARLAAAGEWEVDVAGARLPGRGLAAPDVRPDLREGASLGGACYSVLSLLPGCCSTGLQGTTRSNKGTAA